MPGAYPDDAAKKPGHKARRWVVERTRSWFNRFRSLLTRWSKKADNYLAMLYFVCGLTAYRAALFFGQALSQAERERQALESYAYFGRAFQRLLS